jgi:hypothetical protein
MPRPVSAHMVLLLIAGGVVTPIVLSVVLGLAVLLAAMGDETGGRVLHYVALAGGIFWIIDLVCLVLAQGLNSLGSRVPEDPDETDR